MPVDESATVRRIEDIERSIRELGPSVAKSFSTTVSNLLGIQQGLRVATDTVLYSASTSGYVASPATVELTTEGTRVVTVDTLSEAYLTPGLSSAVVLNSILYIDGQVISDTHPSLVGNPGWMGGQVGLGIGTAGVNGTFQAVGTSRFSILPGTHQFQLYRKITVSGPNGGSVQMYGSSVRVLVNLYSDSNS